MTFPVLLEQIDNRVTASLMGAPDACVTAPTRAEAIAALKIEIAQRVGHGELVALDVEATGVVSLAGKYASDPSLVEISQNAYAQRDAERPE